MMSGGFDIRAEPQTIFMRFRARAGEAGAAALPICTLVGHPWHYRGLQNKIDGNLRRPAAGRLDLGR